MDKETEKIGLENMDRRSFVAGATVVGVSALATSMLAGCGGSSSSASSSASASASTSGSASASGSAAEKIIRYYINQPVCIDTFDLQESEGFQVAFNLYDPLTRFDQLSKKLVGMAAESWEITDNGTKFTFKLRQGATFHNGDMVTAKDFKFAWERICNPKTTDEPSVISYHIDKIKGYDDMIEGKATELSGVVAKDDFTLEVTLVEPFADFVYVVSHLALSPLPSSGATKDFLGFGKAPIGNGAFMIDGKWMDDQYIRLKRFDEYHGEKAKIDGCDFLIFKSPETAFTEFQAGNLDFTQIANGQITSTVAQHGLSTDGYTVTPGNKALLGDESSTYYFLMNHKDPLFADKNVRKAVSMAINRQAICDVIFEGSRGPADGMGAAGRRGQHSRSLGARQGRGQACRRPGSARRRR